MSYSEFQGLGVLAFDWFCLLRIPGGDWNDQEAFKCDCDQECTIILCYMCKNSAIRFQEKSYAVGDLQ